MNIAKIYQDATTVKEALSETPEQVSEKARQQDDAIAHHKWLSADRTQEFFKKLNYSKDEAVTQAVNMAVSYHQHKDHIKIIQLLNTAANLQDIINTYGNRNS